MRKTNHEFFLGRLEKASWKTVMWAKPWKKCVISPQTSTDLFSLCTHWSMYYLFLHSSIKQTKKFLCACFMTHSLCYYSYSIYQHLPYGSWDSIKAAPDIQELAWHLWLGLSVLLLNINNLTKHQHPTRPLCDHDGSRKKQEQITLTHAWTLLKTWTLPNHKNNQTPTYLG